MARIGVNAAVVQDATIREVNLRRGTVRVSVDMAKSDAAHSVDHVIPIPASWSGPNGEFSGGSPRIGASVRVAQGQGGRWAIVGYTLSDSSLGSTYASTTGTSIYNSQLSLLKPGRWLTQVQNDIHLYVDPTAGIRAGNSSDYTQLDPQRGIQSSTFPQQLAFSEARRHIDGVVKRDQRSNSVRNVAGSALTSHTYDNSLIAIGLDPLTTTSKSVTRNPAFTENHNIVYEFANSFGFTNDDDELSLYDEFAQPSLPNGFERRKSRADALSLSLISPNYLIETIQGTVVDVYGNLVDINKSILPSGKIDSLSFRKASEGDRGTVFLNLRAQARKTIAYHFELNARKEGIRGFDQLQFSINDPTDYARDRSRFSVDIDKEGQFKINIPSSSETGNIPLLTRAENFSTLIATDDGTDPRLFRRNKDRQDLFLENFGVGVISLTDEGKATGKAGPVDRREGLGNIKLGTAYHSLQSTLDSHNIETPVPWHLDNRLNNQSEIALVGDIVTTDIIVSGDTANAGGRSGTISADGMLSVSLGANTIDRQSLWVDMAGGYVVNVGRDVRGRSVMGRMDGDVFIQIGAATVDNDSRFPDNNSLRDGALDIRIIQGGNFNILRVDAKGWSVISPGSIDIVARGKLRLKSTDNDAIIDAKRIWLYGDSNDTGRLVLRKPGLTI